MGILGSSISGILGAKALGSQAEAWLAPFLAARLITVRCGRSPLPMLRGLAIAGTILAPFAILEVVTHHDVVLQLFPPTNPVAQMQAGIGIPDVRLGVNRIEAGFGQAVPFAMFMATAAVASAGVAILAEGRRVRNWFGLNAIMLLLLQTFALARSGWLIAVIGVGLTAVLAGRRFIRPGHMAIAALVLAALVVGPFGATRELLLGAPAGTPGVESVSSSSEYRLELLQYVQRPGALEPFGTTIPFVGPGGNPSIDDEYIHLATTLGYVPAICLVLILLATVAALWRARRDLADTILMAVLIANFVAIASVALFGDHQLYFWLLVGTASAAASKPRSAVVPDEASSRSIGAPAVKSS
jgi:hypothetical protein